MLPKSSSSFSSRSLSPLPPSFFVTSDSYSFMLSFSMDCMMSTCTNTQHSTHVGEAHFLKRLTPKIRPHFLKRLILKTRPRSLKRLILKTNENTNTGFNERATILLSFFHCSSAAGAAGSTLGVAGIMVWLSDFGTAAKPRNAGWTNSFLYSWASGKFHLAELSISPRASISSAFTLMPCVGAAMENRQHLFKDIPKDLDMQNYKCLNSKLCTCLNLEIRLPINPKDLKTTRH